MVTFDRTGCFLHGRARLLRRWTSKLELRAHRLHIDTFVAASGEADKGRLAETSIKEPIKCLTLLVISICTRAVVSGGINNMDWHAHRSVQPSSRAT